MRAGMRESAEAGKQQVLSRFFSTIELTPASPIRRSCSLASSVSFVRQDCHIVFPVASSKRVAVRLGSLADVRRIPDKEAVMADDKNKGKPAVPPDKKPVPPEKQPIAKPKVHVTVTPKNPPKTAEEKKRFEEYRDGKVKPNVKKDVGEALEKHKGGGARKQLDGVKEKLDQVRKQVDPNQVKEIEVKIEGEVGGKPMTPDVTRVKPDEGRGSGAAPPDTKKP